MRERQAPSLPDARPGSDSVLTGSGAAGAKFPCSQSVTDCLAGLESATRDDVAAGTLRLTVDGLRHCSFPALSTGESRPGWKGWFCGSMACFSSGGWTGTKWSLRGSPGSIRNIRENLCGVFFATSRIRRALRRRPRPGFMADGIPRIPAVSRKVLSGTPHFAFHFARPLSIGSSDLAVLRGSPAPVTGMRGACRQSAAPMNITQMICQVLPGRDLAAKAASVLERHVFTESGGNS